MSHLLAARMQTYAYNIFNKTEQKEVLRNLDLWSQTILIQVLTLPLIVYVILN